MQIENLKARLGTTSEEEEENPETEEPESKSDEVT